MTKTPDEIYLEYDKAEKLAAEAYEKYWLDLFASAGITFVKVDYSFEALSHGYRLNLYTCPSHYNGVKIDVTLVSKMPFINHQVKIKSDSGCQKFLNKLRRQGFV